MPLEEGDYILKTQFEVPSVFGSKQFSNVWYFKRLVGDGNAIALVSAFNTQFKPAIESILPDYIDTGIGIEALSLDPATPDDTGFLATTFAGTFVSLEASPSFVATGYRIARDTRQNKRHGGKRFGPLAEQMLNGNSPTTLYLSAITAAAGVFNADLTGGISRWRVSIPQSILVDNPPGQLGQHYELQAIHPMSQMLFAAITSQNTRK